MPFSLNGSTRRLAREGKRYATFKPFAAILRLAAQTVSSRSAMRILIVEDDQQNAAYLTARLDALGHAVACAPNGRDGLLRAVELGYDVIVLDRMLPELDGLGVVTRLRSAGIQTPVIFLTCLSGINDRVDGLAAGGDDYLVKPFAFAELLARLTALARRPPLSEQKTILAFADLEMDLIKRTVSRGGEPIELQHREFRLLAYLLHNEGRVVTRKMLLENVWDFHFDPKTSIVETHVCRLRTKVDFGRAVTLIHTLRGIGYSLRVVQ
jgi:two-component system OmpR family response regulator